jgi:hypothetical protein
MIDHAGPAMPLVGDARPAPRRAPDATPDAGLEDTRWL